MPYAVQETPLPGVVVLTPKVFADDRGHFLETFSIDAFREAVGQGHDFVQDNLSVSRQGVLRGLHYQLEPYEQGKLVRCDVGSVFDVVVDVVQGSPTLGEWFGVELTAETARQMWVPPGYAHGFLVTSEFAHVQYKVTKGYAPHAEASILWSDRDVGIDWPSVVEPVLSTKDAQAPLLRDATLMQVER